MPSVAILGGGIAGLTAAYQLDKQGLEVTVFEASNRTGGKIRSERAEDYLIEHGPNTIQSSTPLMEGLIDQLGLDDAVVEADAAAKKRYVVRDGTPHPLPMSPPEFFTTPLFSATAKLRLLAEPLVWKSGPEHDESIAHFARRRLGREALDYGLNPFVGGIFAGDPERLSVRHAFEKLYTLEDEHGSLFKGMIRRMLDRRANSDEQPSTRHMFSFRDGLQQLPDALTTTLGASVERLTAVTALRPEDDGWTVATRHTEDGTTTEHHFDAVVCTLPLHRLAQIDFDTVVSLHPLKKVEYPPVSVVAMGFDRADVHHPLDGFGMLVPEVETPYRILGTIFTSALFPDRAPGDKVLLSTFVGGARNPDLGNAEPDRLVLLIQEDLADLLGVHGEPTFVRHVPWRSAIPQYTVGYAHVKATLDTLENRHPQLAMAGNYRKGVSVGDTMDSADRAAQRILRALEPSA